MWVWASEGKKELINELRKIERVLHAENIVQSNMYLLINKKGHKIND